MTEPQNSETPPTWLSAAELGMWQAFRNGSTYDLRTADPLQNDPHGPRPGARSAACGPGSWPCCCWTARRRCPAGSPPSSCAGVQITGTLDLAGGTIEPYVELKDCRFEEEVLLPEARFTTLRLVDCAVPRLEAARLHTEGDLHLPRCRVEQRHPAHRRAHRHGPAAQPGDRAPGPARPLDRGGRHDRRAGPPGRDDGVVRRAEPARREDRRVAEPARQQAAATRTGPPRAERTAADRRAHALPDGAWIGERHGRGRGHTPVRRRAGGDAGPRHPDAALRVPGRDAARRRPVRRRGRPRAGPLPAGARAGAVAAPDRQTPELRFLGERPERGGSC